MTTAVTTTIMLVTIIGVSSVALGSYYYLEQSATPSPTPAPTATPAAQEETTPSPAAESLAPTPTEQSDRDSQVQGIISIWPTPTTTPRVRPTPTTVPTVAAQKQNTTGEIGVRFIDTPSTVTSGQSFTVKWQATGPTNMQGEKTSLALSYEAQNTNGSSSSRTSSNNSTSFGSFVGPKTFSSNFSFGGASGDINLTATAVINGETVTAHKTIALVN